MLKTHYYIDSHNMLMIRTKQIFIFKEFICEGQTTRGKCKEFYIGETERSLKTHFH